MKNNSQTSAIKFVLHDLPSSFFAFLGFGFFLLATEATRLPAIQNVTSVATTSKESVTLDLLSIALLVILAVAMRNRLARLPVGNVFTMATAVAVSASLLFMWDQIIVSGGSFLYTISRSLYCVSCVLLFFCWVKAIFPHGPLTTAVIFALSLVVLAVTCGMISFIRVEAAAGIMALIPMVSGMCLCIFRKTSQSAITTERTPSTAKKNLGNEQSDAKSPASQESSMGSPLNGALSWVPKTDTPDENEMHDAGQDPSVAFNRRDRITMLVSFAASMFCYALVFGYVHMQWVVFQDGSTMSIIMQIGIALGSGLAGAFILLFVTHFWSYYNLNLYLLLLIPVTLMALWLTSLLHNSSIFFYLILLNFAQKSVLFFAVILPFFIETKRGIYWSWIVAYLPFEVGKVASQLMVKFGIASTIYDTLSTVAVAALFVFGGAIIIIATEQKDAFENRQSSAIDYLPAVKNTTGNRFKNACWDLAEEGRLTERETDAFMLLARGRTAAYIAQDMTISPATAKVYVRSVYAKLNVHSQQDLITLVEKRIEDLNEQAGGK